MIGQLADVLESLLTTSLPDLFGGAAPAAQASVVPDLFTIDPQSVEADAGEPRTTGSWRRMRSTALRRQRRPRRELPECLVAGQL